MSLESIRIVLVEPNHPGNIGAVARAMKTMALTQLFLVRPKTFPSPDAERRSMGAKDLLESATVVSDLEDAIGDCRLVIGSSARGRSFPHEMLDPRECGARLVSEAQDGDPVALLLGPERTGDREGGGEGRGGGRGAHPRRRLRRAREGAREEEGAADGDDHDEAHAEEEAQPVVLDRHVQCGENEQ